MTGTLKRSYLLPFALKYALLVKVMLASVTNKPRNISGLTLQKLTSHSRGRCSSQADGFPS